MGKKEQEFDVTAKVDGEEETDTIEAKSLADAKKQVAEDAEMANEMGLDVEVESVKPHKG